MFRIVSAQQPLLVVMPQTRLKSLARGWEEGGRVAPVLNSLLRRGPSYRWVPWVWVGREPPSPICRTTPLSPHTDIRPLGALDWVLQSCQMTFFQRGKNIFDSDTYL